MNKGKVYLIGSGCGKADLLTLRAKDRIEKADVLVYDDLIDSEILALNERAERIYVGKRSGRHYAPQEEITKLLVRLSKEGKTVARIKGGDPFVFGRGGEEALSLIEEEIPFEVVPGISSSIAIPAEAGIPVTHRALSRGFMVVTGHTKEGAIAEEEIKAMSLFSGTLVILMGLANLRTIAERLIENGKDGKTPASVISGGNSPDPMTVRATLDEIADEAEKSGIRSPAVIVIGKTAGLELRDTGSLPLSKTRIGITGTPVFSGKLRKVLEEKGAFCISVMKSVVEPLPFSVSSILTGEEMLLVFTSSNGIRIFFEKAREERIDMRRFGQVRFAVIGSPTGETLRLYGFEADICPDTYTSESLAKRILKEGKKGEKVVLLRAEEANPVLPEMLASSAIKVEETKLYRVKGDGRKREETEESLKNLDYLTFSSRSGVRNFMTRIGRIPENVRTVAIGEITASELRRNGIKRILVAEKAEAASICELIVRDAEKTKVDGSR